MPTEQQRLRKQTVFSLNLYRNFDLKKKKEWLLTFLGDEVLWKAWPLYKDLFSDNECTRMHALQSIWCLRWYPLLVKNPCFGNSVQLVKVQRVSVRGHSAVDGHLNHHSATTTKPQGPPHRVGRKTVKAWGQGWPYPIFWTRPNYRTHELTGAVITYMSSTPKQAGQCSRMEEEGLTSPHM